MGLKCTMVGFWSFCWIVNLWICFCFVALGQKIICLKCSTLQKTLTGFQGSVFNQISTKIRFHFTFVIKFVCKRILSMIGGWDKILCASNKNTILGRFCFLWCENLLRTPFFSYSVWRRGSDWELCTNVRLASDIGKLSRHVFNMLCRERGRGGNDWGEF